MDSISNWPTAGLHASDHDPLNLCTSQSLSHQFGYKETTGNFVKGHLEFRVYTEQSVLLSIYAHIQLFAPPVISAQKAIRLVRYELPLVYPCLLFSIPFCPFCGWKWLQGMFALPPSQGLRSAWLTCSSVDPLLALFEDGCDISFFSRHEEPPPVAMTFQREQPGSNIN